jgi:hypothetical protein
MLIATGYIELEDYFLNYLKYNNNNNNFLVKIYKNVPINLLKTYNLSCLDWDLDGKNYYYCVKSYELYNLALSFDRLLFDQLDITIN